MISPERLRRSLRVAPDAEVATQLAEVERFAHSDGRLRREEPIEFAEVAVPLRPRSSGGVLSILSTVTVFGTAIDITSAEPSIETFFPVDYATEAALPGGGAAGPRLGS